MIENQEQYREAEGTIRRKKYALGRVHTMLTLLPIKLLLQPEWIEQALQRRQLQLEDDIIQLNKAREEWKNAHRKSRKSSP